MVDYVQEQVKMQLSLCCKSKVKENKVLKQPNFKDIVKLFKLNNYIEIGYLSRIKRVYLL